MYDLIIKGGVIVDGSGGERFEADLAVRDGKVVEIGQLDGRSRREINAEGKLITPGFVDIHSHYDGQATWDPVLAPTSWHGVTTTVMGNCGVGFAPVRPGQEEFLIQLMEGVEDIPGTALHEGIEWSWESFPEYLDALDQRQWTMDVGTQVPHGPLRTYVMGERGANNEPATAEDIEEQAKLVRSGIQAGALGVSMSRTLLHRAVTGEVVPGTFAAEDEIFGVCAPLGELNMGILELAPAGVAGEDLAAPDKEIEWMARLSANIQRPVSFALVQHDMAPDDWLRLMDLTAQAEAQHGGDLRPQVSSRPTTLLLGHETSINPFAFKPTYVTLQTLPFADRIAKLRDPAIRQRILGEESDFPDSNLAGIAQMVSDGTHKIFRLGARPNYEPSPDLSLKAIAEKTNSDPHELLYDWMLELDGKQLLMLTMVNYSHFTLDPVYKMLSMDRTVFGLGDGGAHSSQICDASMTTSMLSHWTRDRTRGPLLSIEAAIKKITSSTAGLYGLNDRGVLAVGKRADLNVIDYDALNLSLPEFTYDLPSGAGRLLQRASGYEHTFVAGVETFAGGEHSGALPGRLVRGARG